MKTKNRNWIYTFIIIGVLIITVESCKKEENSSKKDPIVTWTNPADISYGTLLSETQLNATANVPGTFAYTPGIGTKLSVGANQSLKADFTPSDASTYNTVSKTVKINVNAKKDPIITWANPADITYGTLLSAIQLNATADVPGTFVYTPAIGTQLNVGTNQDLKVDFTPTDAANYNTATKTVTINVIAITTVTDIDGNVYHIVTIGTQTWMEENLKVLHFRNGDPIPNVTNNTQWSNLTTEAYCDYGNISSNSTIYGKIYNWYAVVNSRNLCPTGWHVPTDAEWSTLIANLGGESTAGGKLKELGTTHWTSPNTGADNSSGFTALPGGARGTNGTFNYLGSYGYWWSSSESSTTNAWNRELSSNSNYVDRVSIFKVCGCSVRCIRD